MEHYTKAQQVKDLVAMIDADRRHMHKALDDERYRDANRYQAAVRDNEIELAKLIKE